MKRVVEYDVLRVVTTILVVVGHCGFYDVHTDFGGMYIDLDHACNSLTTRFFNLVCHVIYVFHMPLFMALSGAVFAYAIKRKGGLPSFRAHISSKWRRLMVPMILCALLFSIPLKYISGYWDSTGWELACQVLGGQLLLLGDSNSHLWFLQTLFVIFILAWVIEYFRLRRYRALFLLAVFLLSFCVFYDWRNVSMYGLSFPVWLSMQYLIWFYLGFELEEHREAVNRCLDRISPWHLLYLVPLYFVACVAYPQLSSILMMRACKYFFCFVGMAITYFGCYKLSRVARVRNSRRLAVLSALTFGIYLYSDPLNYPMIAFVRDHGYGQLLYTNVGGILLFTMRFVVSLAGAWLVTVALDRFNAIVKRRREMAVR